MSSIKSLLTDARIDEGELIVCNEKLGVRYFMPKFVTSDGVAIGLDEGGYGMEFDAEELGWSVRVPLPENETLYRVVEVFSEKECKYMSITPKEWYKSLEQACEKYKPGYRVVQVESSVKPSKWLDDMKPIVVSCDLV